MKKFLALLMAALMVLALAACTGKPADTTTEAQKTTEAEQTQGESTDGPETVAMKVAMITDYGDITDQSFNQTTYEACKSFCEANGIEFTYKKPASDNDADRISMIEAAIDEEYNVIVMPGYAFGNAIKATAPENPDVYMIGLDVSEFDLGLETIPSNLYCAVYQEELCGYMAGYAVVKLGYKNLGFLGGMAVPAVQRYGYGYVQGIEAAAKELNLTDVTVKYTYGNQFYGDADITAAMDTWAQDGVELVFSCGGGIYDSACEAAKKVGSKVVGVDVDQNAIISAKYEDDTMCVTSAMKGLAPTVKTLLTSIMEGKFEGGKVDNLGLVSDVPSENYVQIAESTQFADGFTKADYEALVKKLHAGDIKVDNSIDKSAADFVSVVTLTDLGNIK